ncbi:MAG: hypothetical protein GY936_04025 [Ignavibacteriae bacterium]|nr:hypothetical protein [Ignavibacteriota bacterium]
MNKYYSEKKVQIPVTILHTGFDLDDVLYKCKKKGAYTVLRKPTTLKTLVDSVTVFKKKEFCKY